MPLMDKLMDKKAIERLIAGTGDLVFHAQNRISDIDTAIQELNTEKGILLSVIALYSSNGVVAPVSPPYRPETPKQAPAPNEGKKKRNRQPTGDAFRDRVLAVFKSGELLWAYHPDVARHFNIEDKDQNNKEARRALLDLRHNGDLLVATAYRIHPNDGTKIAGSSERAIYGLPKLFDPVTGGIKPEYVEAYHQKLKEYNFSTDKEKARNPEAKNHSESLFNQPTY